jgi:hypothetical protein
MPAWALPFEPGEELKMSVSFLSFDVGEVQCSVQSDQGAHGGHVWPIQVHARSHGWAGAFYKLDDTVSTRFDPVAMRSEGSELLENLGDFHNRETVRINGTSAVVRREFRGNVGEHQETVPQGSMDLLAAVYRLRAEVPPNGSVVRIPIFTGHKSWEMVAQVVGRERLKTDAGTFDTLVVRGQTLFSGKLSTRGDIMVWLSNDDRRLPVRITAPFAIGKMEATLTAFHSGALAQK